MRTETAFGRSAASLSLALLLAAGFGCSGNSGDSDGGGSTPECDRDESEGPDSAIPLMIGEEVEGYLCPIEDEDWYTVELESGYSLLGVDLAMSSAISGVDLTYTLREVSNPEVVAASPDSEAIGSPLKQMHCLDNIGQYYLVVRDYGDNAQDLRHPYKLSVSTASDPDTNEPNNEKVAATELTSGTPITGAIACAGDQDWYQIDVPPGDLLRIRLESDVATYQPAFTLYDADEELVVEKSNPAGHVEETDLDVYRVLPTDGIFYVVVSDDDGVDADPFVTYTLTVDVVNDPDPNEPNNVAEEATPLAGSAVSCGGSWSSFSKTGTVGSEGDNDWFALPITNCNRGVIEADLVLSYSGLSDEEKWDLQHEVQASVALVREHAGSPCSDDLTCRTLNLPCTDLWDCAGFFNNCLPEGLCAGATECLPSGHCAANEAERHYLESPTPSPVSVPPAGDEAHLSAPVFGGSVVYLRVGDFQSDGGRPSAEYTLNVRIRQDPDTHEPNNVYYGGQVLTEDLYESSIGLNISMANSITIHDCTAGDCCTEGNWVSGAISYENDSDWYEHPHPCPNQDCTLRVNYSIDGGPVDHVYAFYHGSSLFFDWPFDGVGHYGGLTASDDCLWASQHHGSQNYHWSVRDIANDGRDWDSSQTYRLCVEKISNICAEPPCVLWDPGGCDNN